MKAYAKPLAVAAALLIGGIGVAGCVSQEKDDKLNHRTELLEQEHQQVAAQIQKIKEQREQARLAALQARPVVLTPSPMSMPPELTTASATVVAGSQPNAQGRQYTVQRGDTLWALARRFYGTGKKWQAIKNANPGKIGSNGELRAGAIIAIPSN